MALARTVPSSRDDSSWSKLDDGRLLEYARPAAFDRLSQAADEPGGVQGGAMGRVQSARGPWWRPRASGPRARSRSLRSASSMPSERACSISRSARCELGRVAGEHHPAALSVVAVDAFGWQLSHPTSSTVRSRALAQLPARLCCRSRAPACAEEVANIAEHQPPLRPEAPKPAVSRSMTARLRARISSLQVVSGPQAGVAGADDGNVDIGVPL